jgi:membrane-bound lytic murein transglycosylase MltF
VVEADRKGLRQALEEDRADLAAAQLGNDAGWRKLALPSVVYSELLLFWIHERGKRRRASATGALAHRDAGGHADHLARGSSGVKRSKLRYTVVPRNVGREPLELVASGRADATLMDGRDRRRPGLHRGVDVAFALPERRSLHWMVRRDGRDLLDAVNAFLATERGETTAPTLEIEALTKPSALPRANS